MTSVWDAFGGKVDSLYGPLPD
ncbi:MAG: hypothetical protein QOE59_4301, partial [Actinomycetota bacterium]|nr:hypothetical protein [Actinomycetota bacterium]